MALPLSLRGPLWAAARRATSYPILRRGRPSNNTTLNVPSIAVHPSRQSPLIGSTYKYWHCVALSLFHTSSSQHAKKGKKHKAKVDVGMSADDDILNMEELDGDMQKVINTLKQDYAKSLSIRTSQGSLDHILVSTSDGNFPLNQLGQITSKSPNLMTVNLSGFPQVVDAAAKAVRDAGMNLNPKVDGSTIQIPIPKVTKEHRENLSKSAKGMCDKSKVNLRNIRSKYVAMVKKHSKGTSKDTIFALEKQIQQVADNFNDAAEQLLAAKTKELLGK